VDGLDLEVPRGSVYGLLGPNGSGKTTTIRMIMGILEPDTGTVSLFGGSPDDARRDRVGYLPEERGLYRRMRVLEHLVFLGRIRGMERVPAREASREWLERLGLGGVEGKRVEELSKGMQQKVQFIGTVLHEPDLLILDEPFSGLDPLNQDLLEGIVRDFASRGTTVLFSTHLMEQAERLCERVCLVSRARKVLDGTLQRLRQDAADGIVAVDFSGDDRWIAGTDVEGWEEVPGGARVRLRAGADPHDLLERAVASGARIARFQVAEPRLHEIFVRHTGGRTDEGGFSPGPVPGAAERAR
jgi:ABC-2 type transport system ATP-binding protein